MRRAKRVVVWGLKEPAVLRFDGESTVESMGPRDRAFVHGFATGLGQMPRLDFARRLWSGRLAEFLGPKPLGSMDAYRLDVAVRGLGFRRRAERLFRTLSEETKRDADSWAAGVNAWIDQREVPLSPTYKALQTGPRLVGAADALLVQLAPLEVDRTAPGAIGAIGAIWDLLSGPALRAPGSVGDVDSRLLPRFDLNPTPSGAPSITTRTVLAQDDGHLYRDGDEPPKRLYVDRPNVAVKGGEVRRPWVRRTPEGWVISDMSAEGPEPPTGPARVVEWPVPIEGAPPPPVAHPSLDPGHPWRVHRAAPRRPITIELVPKRG